MEPSFLLQLLVNGIVIGVIYALIAMGLSLIFGVLEIVNFAHGEFYMLGAMLAYFLSTQATLGYWPTILIVTLVAVCVGFVLYEALLAPVHGEGFERSILLTLGLVDGAAERRGVPVHHHAEDDHRRPHLPEHRRSATCACRCCACTPWGSGWPHLPRSTWSSTARASARRCAAWRRTARRR